LSCNKFPGQKSFRVQRLWPICIVYGYKYAMKFHITYQGEPVSVELLSQNANIYAIEMPGQPVLFIALVTNIRDKPYWTSIPQGREMLASEMGFLIEQHLKQAAPKG
jgi:hypothetical protein